MVIDVGGLIQRRPFHPEEVPALIAFATKHPVAFVDASTFEHGLTRMISGRGAVIDLHAGGERVALAVVYDRLEEPPDSVLAALIAATAVPDWAAVCELVLDAAAELARAAHKPKVTVSWHEPLPPEVGAVFARRNHRQLLQECRMERPPGPPGVAIPGLAGAWRWHDVSDERVRTALHLMRQAFAGTPTFLPGEDDLARFLVGEQQRSRLLCDADRPAGFVRVAVDPGQRCGYVGPIARHPEYRGRGLGDVLVAECLTLLGGMGAAKVYLDVISSNTPAIELYLRHGFRHRRRIGYYQGPAADVD
jgi:ribosomal protein S18 acetylase RimI-like enzyme